MDYENARNMYLLGYKGKDIQRQTGVSVQSLLKYLLANGIVYTKDDIANHQIDFIRKNYTIEEVINAYITMSESFDDLWDASRKKKIMALGCVFGRYKVVFEKLLGKDEYKKLRDECWSKKQKKTMGQKYGVNNFFKFGKMEKNPMLDEKCKEKRRKTMLRKYGVEHPNQNPSIKEKMLKTYNSTMRQRYGVNWPTEDKNIAQKVSKNRQKTMLKKYGAKNSVEIEDIRNKIFKARIKNGTQSTSKPEEYLYELLVGIFGEEDVKRNVCVDKRYPYHVDFYVVSRDLFIELNGDRCHYHHWFDENDPKDVQVVKSWKCRNEELTLQRGKPSRYANYIKVWTISDVEKRRIAKKNQLNYLVFWDGSCSIDSKRNSYPNLSDVLAWINAGCPDSKDWKKENTY